jgi:4-hydroxybenzoate polyprenyltransferase
MPLANHQSAKVFRFAFVCRVCIHSLIDKAIKILKICRDAAMVVALPIIWGVNATKVYVAVWMIILIAILAIIQVCIAVSWWWAVVYCVVMIILPMLYIFIKLFKASSIQDYHQLSKWTKLVMLTGIVSMLFFYFYLS